MCIETDRFEQCALVGDTVDHASLGGGSLECYSAFNGGNAYRD